MVKGIIKRKKTVITHAGALLILFGVPLLFNDFDQSATFAGMMRDWLPLISFAIVFYINYLYLIDKYFFTKKYVHFALANVLIFAVIIFLVHLGHEFVWKNFEHGSEHFRRPPSELFIFYSQFFSLMVSSIVSIAVKSVQRNNLMEKEKKDIERIHLETELNQLKAQINPHFLFNTLNNIYSLIAKDQPRAQESVHMLSHMMRYVLYESQSDFVPISKEIGFIKNYISLMKLRLSENVKLELNINESGKEYMIAPLVLIAFVENAFKHCSLTVKGSFIKINIEFNDDTLIYSTANTMGREKSVEENHSGVGLANLQKRLSLLYGNDYSLSSFMKDNVFHSSLELKLKG